MDPARNPPESVATEPPKGTKSHVISRFRISLATAIGMLYLPEEKAKEGKDKEKEKGKEVPTLRIRGGRRKTSGTRNIKDASKHLQHPQQQFRSVPFAAMDRAATVRSRVVGATASRI
jgi:hypothetical protein